MTWKPERRQVRRTLRILIPVVMLGFAVITVSLEGWNGLLALTPILAIHVLVALVVVPLWVRYQRRASGTKLSEGG